MTVVQIPKRLQDENDQLKVVNGEIELASKNIKMLGILVTAP